MTATITVTSSVTLTLILANSVAQLGFMITFVLPNNTENSSDSQQSNIYKLLDLANTVSQGVHVLEYIILVCSFYQFTRNQSIESDRLKEEAANLFHKSYPIIKIIMLLAFFIFYIAVITVTPALYRAWDEFSYTPQVVSHIYTITVFGAHLSIFITRAVMIITMLLVRTAWLSASQTLQQDDDSKDGRTTQTGDITSIQTNEQPFEDLVKNYDESGQFVSSLQSIFQQWFVLQ